MRYLAIDPGEKRTGLAVGDDVTHLALPLKVIVTANPRERLRQVGAAIDEYGPDVLVLGLPLNMDGSEGPAAQRMRKFGEQLAREFQRPVHMADERLTSAAADAQMAGSKLTRGRKKARRDALAAAAILRDFLAAL